MYFSTLTALSEMEIDVVAAAGPGGSAAHAAFIGAAAATGGAIGARFGDLTGSEFGALLGGALGSVGGPESAAAGAAVGGLIGLSLGDVSGRDAGAGAAVAIAEDIWQAMFGSDDNGGPQPTDYSPDDFVDNLDYDATDNSYQDTEFDDDGNWEVDDQGGDTWDADYSSYEYA
jgi:hypothetical protein